VNFQFAFDFARQRSHTAEQMFGPNNLRPDALFSSMF
jgi:hypothetical protein